MLPAAKKLARVPLADTYAQRVISLLELIDAHDARFTTRIAAEVRGDRWCTAIQVLLGVGPTLAPGHGQDHSSSLTLREHCGELLRAPEHPVFGLISAEWLTKAVSVDTPEVTQVSRRGLERSLDLALWMELYSPTLTL